MSPNYPAAYTNNEKCDITVQANSPAIEVVDFNVEAGFDKVLVNGFTCPGQFNLHGTVPTTNIHWTSDDSTTASGWKLCPRAAGPSPTTQAPTQAPTAPPSGATLCDFEPSSEPKPYCGMWADRSKGDEFDWTRKSGNTPSGSTGPTSGASSGSYYLFIESSSPRRPGDKAILEACHLTIGNGAFLKLKYHMHGSSMGKLEVKVGSTQMWLAEGDKGDSWKDATVDLSTQQGHGCVSIVGTRGASWKGDAAIDDVEFYPGTAGPTQPPTQPPTQAPTQPPTQPPTQAPTQPPTQAPTQAPTQPPTQPPSPTNGTLEQKVDSLAKEVEAHDAILKALIDGTTQAPTQGPTQPPTGPANDPQAATWLLSHNYFRCIHNTPPIAWDNDVAAGAATWAEKGQMVHSNSYSIPAPQGPAGENLAAGYNDIATAVRGWYDESPEKGPGCGGHCTAVLWKKSTALGCSKKNTWNGNRPLYVCRYAKSAANFGSKADGVNAQDMSKEPDCYKKYPVDKRWTGSSSGGGGSR